ncbi:hypothetical protein B0H19DRAFT_1369289 [Mycena capillaripes]|nr:hypothetical protein B0H19DRAFT_1369289 [Mycena capillaripes]
MVAHKIISQLPVELLEAIISTAWHMSLSSDERITLMRSLALVNSTWAHIFDLVSSRDVYIPSAAFCDHFIQRLRDQPPAVPPSSSVFGRFLDRFRRQFKPSLEARSANLACQSLTIQIINGDIHPDKNGRMRLPMGAVLDDLLENLDARSLAPNMRRLSIEYLDAGFEDVFQRAGLAALPTQITHIELRYSFSAETPHWLVESLRRKQEMQRYIGWIARSITHLSIVGAGENTVQDALRVCPSTQRLEVDGCDIRLDSKIRHSEFV